MPFTETLRLESVTPIDPRLLHELGEQLHHRGIETFFVELESYTMEACKTLILQHGSTHILSVKRLQEAVLPKVKPEDGKDLLLKTITTYLESLSPTRSLVVIDAHFLPRKLPDAASYVRTVTDTLAPIIPKIATMRFIIRPEFNSSLYETIRRHIVALNPGLDVSCKTTSDFHDRFWIVDQTRGLFVGTSLNGVGLRCALIHFMRDEDAAFIVTELRRLALF